MVRATDQAATKSTRRRTDDTMSQDVDGYGARVGASDIDRLIEDCRTLSPSGVERIAATWAHDAAGDSGERAVAHHDAWHRAEGAALHVLEVSNRVRAVGRCPQPHP
jgi:hypothetical protein